MQRAIPNVSDKMATVKQTACLWFQESKLIVTAQRRFRLEYRSCHSPSENSIVRRPYKQFNGEGNMHHRKGAGRPSVSDVVAE
ncbi:hypothetical protein AVEN_220989-1 [Araneus ventricosus]|uniref:DUF4817 domain-containing protein n=1 Tax=Araneus ventricosus TaxID=182803 RepID=A0A4Y2ENE1_ARAVE|nr:hypothetical protein AVEN_220989-1 [Araneus ventricosus]